MASKNKNDQVNHPKHYTSDPSGIECIDITQYYSGRYGGRKLYQFCNFSGSHPGQSVIGTPGSWRETAFGNGTNYCRISHSFSYSLNRLILNLFTKLQSH